MDTLPFTIDAELLKELGERLVGKPHVALAELIKNGYDADATQVTINFLPEKDYIKIRDNGHGMTFEEFKKFWMRIGTTHKKTRQSRNLKRPMTGSKGVGRLAVQFLAKKLHIKTVPMDNNGEWLEAEVNWEEAIKARDLTKVEVFYSLKNTNPPFSHGTLILLSGLKDEWEDDDDKNKLKRNPVQDLASEIWWLQPPFGSSFSTDDTDDLFRVQFESKRQDYAERFSKQMDAIKRIWIARLVGQTDKGEVTASLEFRDGDLKVQKYNIKDFPHNDGKFSKTKNLKASRFEVRIYNLSGRQGLGIKVGDARKYFAEHGGIHVYDGNFRLPYYGLPTSDWLALEYDHSHRKNTSKLLPDTLESIPKALNDLPTLGRVLGVVKVDTSNEPNLKIMITRDRLTETTAYDDLVCTVRYAIDWYAYETARRKSIEKKRETPTQATSQTLERIEQVLEQHERDLPKDVYQKVHDEVQIATSTVMTNQEVVLEQIGLLAPLATAGISALSYQHELQKQFGFIEGLIDRIKYVQTADYQLQQDLTSLRTDLASWLERAKATNGLFDYIADTENTKLRHRFRAVSVIMDIVEQTRFLARGIEIDYSQLENEIFLPKASYAEWGAIFQNVFINAFNAMLDSSKRLLHISSQSDRKSREILIQDTGHGVNLLDSSRLFEPFERESPISPARQALGYGGTGLGLTIVRLLADNIDCRVHFVDPQDGFSTAFSIRWREKK